VIRFIGGAAIALAAAYARGAEPVAALTPNADGRPACYSQEIRLPDRRPLLAKLCVVRGDAGRREYYAQIEGKIVAGGDTAEVADGATGTYQEVPLTVRCLPLSRAPEQIEGGRDCSLRLSNLVELMRVRIWQQ